MDRINYLKTESWDDGVQMGCGMIGIYRLCKGLVQSLLLTIDHDFILRRRPNTIGYHREKGGNGEEERNQRARQVLFWKKKKKRWGPSSKRDVLAGLQQ